MSKPKGRARQFAELVERPVNDFDPEVEVPEDDTSNSEESADENAGTEHYVSVGKSKLRRKDLVSLGPQYKGAPVSRAALEDDDDDEESGSDEVPSDYEDALQEIDGESGSEEFDNPDDADLEADQDDEDIEIDSDNAFNESDEEKFKGFVFRGSSQTIPQKGKRVARPTAADYMVSDEDDSASASEGAELDEEEDSDGDESISDGEGIDGFIDDEAEEDEEEDEDDIDEDMDDASDAGSDEDEFDEEEDGDSGKPPGTNNTNRSTIQEMMNAGQRAVAGTLSTAAQKDIAKGKAVQQQRKAFDALLNIRIRLQKSLVAVNSFNSLEDLGDQSQPYEAAEAAALKLWNTIDGFRTSIQSDQSGKTGNKRKRTADIEISNQDMWENMEAVEQRALVRRRAVLEKWSNNARNIRMVDRSSRRFTNTVEKSLTKRLDEELITPERLIKRTRTPRSCAPVQVARKVNEDPSIYDDADFYQLLLKELVDQRTGDMSGAPGGPAATIRFAAVKEAKAKRHVDTKASKGRKMRFNVHDKLQNFMAPEDRRSWEQSAIDRFFGTLFGQKMVLNEDDDDDNKEASDEEMGGAPIADGGIRLFR
ncbi:TRAUB-domain-containing protein [Annulohypoxylon maeteangense]|uniref:TRAUB-domain-containing protein n=1 Tax=Annulohypoxylon maeteangense TaxID=1927788 RepID=UPI002007CA9F|nr:TRAUB-domain-containing protein [Annulohypoxylon maeteangense]KAI0888300.1 TRAUB-domain-containing protein [Annulohypoxylon maeteangense]